MNKEYSLLKAINKFDIVPGKKALHKILYFTNLQTHDFTYRQNNFGPYSEDIQQFYVDASSDNTILVREEALNEVAIQYNISLDQRGKTQLETLTSDETINHKVIDSAIDFAYDLLNDKNPRQMELLASVHYITNYDCELDSERIWGIINTLKPKSNFSLDEVEEALDILHTVKLA